MAIPTALLSIADLSPTDISELIEKARSLKKEPSKPRLSGKVLALLFEKPSLRTKVSFDVAMWQLGGHSVYLSPTEVGLGKREAISDVARTLGRYVNCIAARTFSHRTLELLAEYSGLPVVNALSDHEHPCQALGDLLTIAEKRGKLRGLKLAYVGDGNNVARSLVLAASSAGMSCAVASPPSYVLDEMTVRQARLWASRCGAEVVLTPDPRRAVENADVVYTDVWTSMGQEGEAETRRIAFASYRVDEPLLSLAKQHALFMHPLPAHRGEEVADGIIDSPQSVVFDQAENRLHIQKAVLLRMLGG
ncbi:MAG: ornithine carbamoyltransferase [Chloroflexi bacterium]|nr:ornithine carbamoyltransferase [Chloroflexota bacterium]